MGTFEIFSTTPLWINRKFTLFQKKKWNSGEYFGIEGVSCADIAQLTCDIALCSLCVGIQLPNAAQLSRYKDLQICAFLRCFWQLKKQNHNKYPFYNVQIQAATYILIVHQGDYFKQLLGLRSFLLLCFCNIPQHYFCFQTFRWPVWFGENQLSF